MDNNHQGIWKMSIRIVSEEKGDSPRGTSAVAGRVRANRKQYQISVFFPFATDISRPG